MSQDNKQVASSPWHRENVEPLKIERVQLGARIEKRMVKVLKALAEKADTSLGSLLEDVILHAFEGVSPYGHPDDLEMIKDFKRLYNMDYDVHASYRFAEDVQPGAS